MTDKEIAQCHHCGKLGEISWEGSQQVGEPLCEICFNILEKEWEIDDEEGLCKW